MMVPSCSRKWFCIVSFVALSSTAVAESPSGLWQFSVHLDDAEVGYHEVRIVEQGEHLLATSRVAITVKVLFFEAYRYEHEAREVWRQGCLEAIESQTDDNGKTHAVNGERQGDQFSIEAQHGHATLPACPMSFAYWNPAILNRAKLLNAQTGEHVDVRIEYAGEQLFAVNGNDVKVRRYELSTEGRQFAVWYDLDGRWLGLEAQVEEGRKLRYVPKNWPRIPEALARWDDVGGHGGS